MKRRELLTGVIAVSSLWPARRLRAAGAPGYSAEKYSKAIVIDALGDLGGHHPELPDDAPLPDRRMQATRAMTWDEFAEFEEIFRLWEQDRTGDQTRRFRELMRLDMPISNNPGESFGDYIADGMAVGRPRRRVSIAR